MKKTITTLLLTIIVSFIIVAQPPQAFKYQAVMRDNTGEIIQTQSIGIRISIHDATTGGTIIYQETFNQTTNQFGLVNLEIGYGTSTIGTFAGIDWSSNSKFLETEIDQEGGSNYVSVGTSELLSVPYALYSERSKDAPWEISGNEIFYNDGNVGIGTSNPAGSLDVRGAGTDDGVVINLGNSDLSHKLTLFGGRESDPNPFLLWKDGDPFRFATDASDFTERMRITSEGRVGIGTINPWAGLHVKGNGYPNSFMFLQSDTSADAGLRFYEGDTVKWHIFNRATADALYIYNSNNTHTVFCADQTSGNVGIGTTTPEATLHVDDRIRVGIFPYGELIREGSGAGFKINTHSGGGWADMHFQTNGTTKMFLESAGAVGIGTTSPTQKLDVNGGGRFRNLSTGSVANAVYQTSDGTLITGSSDIRLKENIKPLQGSLDKVRQLQGVSFTWKQDPGIGKSIGFIAQDFQKVVPELAFTNQVDGYKGINYAEISALLVEAIKEQQWIIETLEERIEILENHISENK
ncbi:MAG: tail fiber domain-containing protein [Bacteroidales bacterium]|nr:tail fiber domain-containing protein [Bacteroidales bacterium]